MAPIGKIYCYPNNPRVFKILIAAQYNELEVEVAEFELGTDNKKPEYLAKFHNEKVPAFESTEGNIYLNESGAIAYYVASQKEGTQLLGKDKTETSQVLQYILFAENEITPHANTWVNPILGITSYNKAAHSQAVDGLKKSLGVLEKVLLNKTYLIGERITLADIAVSTSLYLPFKLVLDAEFRKNHQNLSRWYITLINQPAFKKVLGEITLAEVAVAYTHSLPPSPLNLEEWKRVYSNNDTRPTAITWFWEHFDPAGYSIWRVDYKYNEELTKVFMSSNLIGGFFNRLERARKYAFGSLVVLGEDNANSISGYFVIRGQEIPEEVSDAADFESYNFQKVDHTDATVKSSFEDFIAWDGHLDGKKFADAFEETIMSASNSLQKDVSIAYFGPEGSYTHQVAIEKFGDSVSYSPQSTINDVFDSVEKGLVTYGIVPFENSTFGSVIATLDRFITCKTQIFAETYFQVYSHPQGFGQCQKYLDTHLKGVQRVDAMSTSKAAEIAASEPYSAAIASIVCAELYGLNILEKDIQDAKINITRFFILGSSSDIPSDDDKTFILFTVDHRKPEALCDALNSFKSQHVNLIKIDSRPSLQRLWHYVFFIELQGHKEDEEVRNALSKLKECCLDIKILGSYPSQRPEITDIIRHLVQNKNYIIYGSWLCRRGELERCDEWQSQKPLKKYLTETPKINDFKKQNCEKCRNNLISSFRLYKQQSKKLDVIPNDKKPNIEIFVNLTWNNHYRVFGDWKCQNCSNRWRSAHTYISLQKFIEKTPGKRLSQDHFYMQQCRRCFNTSLILNYNPIVPNLGIYDNDKPHIIGLCAKCMSGKYCVDAYRD
ncbi:12747_t:CDS:10 [Funneliformis geosporum]|uniref:12747_t:CDS:1 n=1 Tax=Funneliformis geosporum TaxID=1117311 RepID=A0A9W4SSJ9_9GLOM|nr:12747_t:CDS:10 [Funneliformis geosporum]